MIYFCSMSPRNDFSLQLETPRLLLFTAQSGHVDDILLYLSENKMFFKPWMPRYTDFFHSRLEQMQWVENDQKLFDLKVKLKFYFALKEAPQNIVGDVVFTNIIYGVFQSCFMGYKQAEKFGGNGYMKEAISKGVEYLFNSWKLHRIEANIVPRNEKSIRLITGLGFEKEGYSKKYLKLNGKWEDHLHFVKRNLELEIDENI